MNDEYLKKLYSYLGAQDSEYHKRTTYDDFKSKMGSEDYSTKVHSYIKGIDSEFRSLEDFNSKIKKKSDWGSTLGSGSLELQKPEDYTYGDSKSAYRKQGNQWLISNESTKGNYVAIKDPTGSRAKELEKNAVKKDNKFISKETKKEYQLEDNNFSEVNPEKQKALRELNAMKYAPPKPGPMGHGSMPAFSAEAIKIKEDEYNNIPSRINLEDNDKIKALNKQFGKNASLDADYETFGDYDNSSEKKNNKYRIKNNSWERWVPGATAWSPISNEGSISALNRRYGKNIEAKKAIVVKPKEIDPFLKVNSNFLAQSEESAQEMLEKNFKGMGFAFEQVGAGDYIKVTPNNGVPSQTFSFKTAKSTNGAFSSPTGMGGFNDNSKENIDQAVKLQSYLRLNASAEKEDDLSAVNIIKNNTSRGKAAYVDPNNFIENNKYYESEDYKNAFKELTFQQKKNEIREREREAVNLSIADGDGWLMESINEYIFGDTPNAKARKERLLKAKQTLYKSEEYKLYYNEQKKYDEQQGEKYDKLYDEYVIVKQSGNKEDIKTVKAKIEGGYSKELIGDNLTHMTGSQYDLQRNINNFNKRKEKLELDAKNGNLTQEQYNDAVEDLSSEAQRLDIAAKNVAATQKKMNALAGVYVTEKAKSGGFFGNFTNALVVGMDEVREPLSYIFPLIGKDLSGDEARKISLDSKIITPQQRQYYKDKGFTDEQIKNVLLNNVQKNAIAANKRAIIETFGSDLTTEESKQNLGFFEQALVGVAASLPSMLTRAVPIVGAPLAFASMANMSYNAINEEMLNDTDFETTSEAERAVVAVPYALVMGALENIGLKYMTSGKSTLLAKSILSAVAKVLPAKAGREVAEKVINKEVKSLVGKGAIKIVNGTLVEGETGFYQAALLDVGLKSLFNVLDPLDLKLTNKEGLTGGEAFTTPDTKMGVAGAILEGAAAEAIGGFAMSTVMTGAQGLINGKISLYNKEDLKFFEDFSSDQEFKKLIVSKLKTEMLNGTMTKGEAQSALNDIDLVEGVFNSIDENISDEAKIIAFNLINERNRLEKEVIGKDPALSKEKNDRIKDINNKLGTLPLQVLVVNNIERATKLENALKQKGAVIIDGETINRKAAQTELDKINQKVTDAVQKQAAGQVLTPKVKKSIEKINEQRDQELNSKVLYTDNPTEEEISKRGVERAKEINDRYDNIIKGAIERSSLTEEGKAEEVAPLTIQEELQLIEEEKAKADIERKRQEELNQQTDAGYSTIALDYLFTGGRDVIQSSDYLLQALVGGFTNAATEINNIRNKYADKLGNIKDDINSDVYNKMMSEIRDVISKNYNNSKATEIFDKILKNATGFISREGNQVSSELDKLNEQNESKINAKYDAEYLDAVKKGEMTKEQAMKALEDVGRKDSKAYAELAALEAPVVEEILTPTTEVKTEEVAPLTLEEELQVIEEEKAKAPKAPVVETTGATAKKKKGKTPKYARNVAALITPATTRNFDATTKRMQRLSLKYDELVKKMEESKVVTNEDEKQLKKIENQILGQVKKEIVEGISKIKGVEVLFRDNYSGAWGGVAEPSMNMSLKITEDADTEAISRLLQEFGEKYSQDAIIIETTSEFSDDIINEKIKPKFSYTDNRGFLHYPQIFYKFASTPTSKQLADLGKLLKENGINDYSFNNNELKVSIISFEDNQTETQLKQDYEKRHEKIKQSVINALGLTEDGDVVSTEVRYRKSRYVGSKNDGDTSTEERPYDRSDIFKEVKEDVIKAQEEGLELGTIRDKQIALQEKGRDLNSAEKRRLAKLTSTVQPIVQETFETKEKDFEEAKKEVESIADKAIRRLKGFVSKFAIKRPTRASVKTLRWYSADTEKLGDGARVNIIVPTDEEANLVFKNIDEGNKKDSQLRRINEATELGYPKRLIEIRAKNGVISEVQVMTPEGYLAKDGYKFFPPEQQEEAKQKLQETQQKFGWAIPDGLGHYFYEIERDFNVDKSLREEAKRLSLKYYDAFLNNVKWDEQQFADEMSAFKDRIDSDKKIGWDAGNEGKSPKSLDAFLNKEKAAPVVKAKAPKTKGEPTPMRWDDVEEYDDAIIRAMKEIQYGKLKPLLALGKRTTVAQKEEIRTIQEKISTAERILGRRANKIKKEAQRVEKEGKGATVRAVDNNGTEAEYSVVVSKDGATAKVQLKKIGTLTPKRASVEANLIIQTDEKRGRFVITKNKTKVYIDEAITTAKVEPTKAKVETDKLNSEEKQYALESGIPEEDAIPTRSIFKKVISRTGITVERVKQLIKSNKYTEKKVKVDEISPSQLVIERDLISKIENKDNLPIIGQLGNEFIVLDGHHRISTYIRNGAKTINAKVIDLSTIQTKAAPVKEEAKVAPVVKKKEVPNYLRFLETESTSKKKALLWSILKNNYLTQDQAEENNGNYSRLNIYFNGELDEFADVKAFNKENYYDFDMFEKQIQEILKDKSVTLIELQYGDYNGVGTQWLNLYEAPVKEETEAEKISRGAEMLKNMSEDERDIFLEDWIDGNIPRESLPGGNMARNLYEAKKLVPKPTSKPKRTSIDNAFSLSMEQGFVINIDGVVYGLNKYEDPDATSDATDNYGDPKQYVWAYTDMSKGDEVIETWHSDIDELINEIKSTKKAEPVKAEAPAPAKESTDDLMGAIDSIKEDIEDTTKEIEDTRKVAREKINKIREEILDLKESKGKEGTIMDLEADIKEIEDILKEDLDGLKLDLDRHVQALKEEVKKIEALDAKNPENKKTLLSYLDAAIATLNGLNKLTYAGIGVGTSLATLKLILKGIRAGVIAGNTINASIKAMASQYRGKHKNKKITIAEFTKEIEEYLRNTFVDQKTNEQDIQEARDKFVEIREAVRKAKVAVKTESKVLRANAENAIREMLKGKVKNLSAVQMKSIMLRLARFNVFSQTQYDKFIDYVDKVIGIADYDAKVNEANKNRKNAKKNTIGDKPKLGDITPDLFRSLSIMLNIDAKLIPSDVFESYYKIVDMLSKRDTVLQLEQRSFLNENVDKIIASIELNDEKISDLKELYDNFEKIKEDGKVDYSGTLAKMLKDDVINQDEYELMKTFKSKIVEAKVKDKMTEQEIADEKAELIDEVNNTTITLNEIVGDEFRLERELAKRLQVLLKQTDLKNLNNKDLKKLLIIIDNINNGFVSNATQLMVEKLNSTKKSIPLATSVHAKITSLYNKMNRFISKTFSRDEFRIAVAPLNLIDEQFGDFQTKNIYNSVFKDSAKAQQAFEAEISKIRAELTEIEKSLDKFFDKDRNKKVASKIKMMIYMLQIEKNSNPNSNKVHNAIDILDATIKFSKENSKKSKNSKADLKVLESIRENFVKDEQIDMVELFTSFGAQEKNALKKLQEINNSMTKKAAYTATVINGNKITTFDNYIFHNTISASDDMSVDALVNNISDNMQPTTKSKNLEERGDKALAMNLNPFLAVTVSSRSVLLNYHLTEPIRTARKTLIDTIKLLDAEKANGEKNKMTSEERKDFEAATKEQYDILNAIKDAYETATKDLLTSNFTESKQWIEWFSKQGYRAVLASAPRAVAELTSNGLFVLSAFPKEITIGFNSTFSLSNSNDAKNILESLGSSLISRLYPEDSLSSVWLDTSAFANRISRDGKMKPKMVNGVLKFHDKYTGHWVDAVSFMADNLIAKPDQAIMRPLWFGSFVNSFKNKTGVEPDFNKIKENDEAYMDEYRDALEEARDVADNNADLTGGNMNPYMSSLQNVIRKEDSFPKVWLKTFQKYMNKFTVKEYYTARKGVHALVGDGDITQKQGALILTGVALRMTMYTTITRLLSEFIMYSFGLGDDDDEEDDDYNAKHIGRKLYQGFTSMLTTLILGRRFGNVVRMAENYFIEWANETYGEDIGLRNGEYDPYEDAVQFNQLQDGKIDKTTDLVKVIAGPYAPAVGFSDLVIKKARELRAPEAKTERARITKAKEWGRLGLETTGFLGIMPLYKDVRKVFMGYTYKELKKETKETAVKKEAKAKTDAEEISQKTISLKEMMNSGEYTREGIKKELRKIKDPEYRKALKDKDDAIRKKILDKYGYENLTDFKRNDEDNYEIEFGDDSPYRIERAESAKIANELEKRLNALEDGEEYYPTDGAAIVVPKKKVNKYNRYKSVQNNNLPDFYSKSYKKY